VPKKARILHKAREKLKQNAQNMLPIMVLSSRPGLPGNRDDLSAARHFGNNRGIRESRESAWRQPVLSKAARETPAINTTTLAPASRG
jgi:hypothetical protein